MQAEPATVEAAPDPLGAVPRLEPIHVIDEAQGTTVQRAARADLAQLALRLRAVAACPSPAEREELEDASVLLQTSLERTIDGRRQELRDELEQVRADAAAHVAMARHDAAEMVAEATDATLQTLLRGIRPSAAPRLRVVADSAPAPGRALTVGALEGPRQPSHPAGTGSPPEPTEVPGPAPRLEASVQQAVTAALAEVFSDAARQSRRDEGMRLDGAPVEPPGVRITASLAAAPETSSTPAVVPITAVPTGRSGVGRFLYADVLLPMVAVVIVLVILLAWVG